MKLFQKMINKLALVGGLALAVGFSGNALADDPQRLLTSYNAQGFLLGLENNSCSVASNSWLTTNYFLTTNYYNPTNYHLTTNSYLTTNWSLTTNWVWTIEATTNSVWTTNNSGAITNNSVWTLVGFLNAAGYQGTNHLTDSNAWAYDHRIYRASCGNLRATNVVGFIKREAATNNLVIANQFVNRSTGYSNNTVTNLFSTVPAGVGVDAHLGTNWDTDYYYGDGEWDKPGMTLNPGEGFVFINRSGYVFDILLYGDLISESADNFIQPGMHLVSSAMPVSGLLCADLGFPIRNGETIFLWNGAAYDQYLYQSGAWSPYEPCIHVGEGFWVNKVSGAWWWQNYSAW